LGRFGENFGANFDTNSPSVAGGPYQRARRLRLAPPRRIREFELSAEASIAIILRPLTIGPLILPLLLRSTIGRGDIALEIKERVKACITPVKAKAITLTGSINRFASRREMFMAVEGQDKLMFAAQTVRLKELDVLKALFFLDML